MALPRGQTYTEHRRRYAEVYRASARKIRARNKQYILEYKKMHPCTQCGETDPVLLEFHHVRGVKRLNVSRMALGMSLDAVKDEIKKCEVFCVRCHRLQTYKDRCESTRNGTTFLGRETSIMAVAS